MACCGRDVRGGMVERGLQSIGVEKLSKEEVNNMEWEELEKRIEGWRRQIRLAVGGADTDTHAHAHTHADMHTYAPTTCTRVHTCTH